MNYILIDDFDNIKNLDLEENEQYVCLMEGWDGNKMAWKAIIGNFYKEGTQVTLFDCNNLPHRYTAKSNGFYFLNPIVKPGGANFVRLNEVRYYKKLEYPIREPDSFLQIEK